MTVVAKYVLVSAVAVSSLCRAQSEPTELDLTDDGKLPVVITPTRLRQSLADVPASVTIIWSPRSFA